MARIAGVDIPREKRAVVSLTYIYGIGRTLASHVCEATDIDENTRVMNLTDDEVAKLRSYIEGELRVEGDLRREVQQDIDERYVYSSRMSDAKDSVDRKYVKAQPA